MLGSFLVEQGQLLRAEGRLVSCLTFVEYACILIAGPLAGYLAGLTIGAAAIVVAAIAVVIALSQPCALQSPFKTNPKLSEPRTFYAISGPCCIHAHYVAGCNFFARFQHSAIVRNASLFLSEERARSL